MVNKPARVLQVLNNLNRGGAENFVMNVYRAIDKTKIQFDFIVHSDDVGDFSEEIISMGGKIFVCPKYRGKNHISYVNWWKKFFSEHKEYGAIHSHIRSTASIYLPIARKNGVKTIVHSHSTSNGTGLSSVVKQILQYPLRWCSDYCFACSKEAGEWLYGKKIVKSKKYYYIPNAVDLSKFSYNSSKRDEYRKELNVSDKLVYIHVGRFNEVKNHKFLIETFKEINKKLPDSVLLLVGTGELFEAIKGYINDNDMSDIVYLLGKRSDVPYLYSMADCLLFPSLWEGLPVSLVEAQASGIPCFISDTISNDVSISDLVRRLPINQGAQCWVDAVVNANLERKDVRDQLTKAGYDINALAEWLQNFYICCDKKS